MFGIGGSEIIVILVIALLFLGPDKLPDAAKTISKGIRDLKKQSRALQHQIESDEKIGGAIRDLKSALRGEDLPTRPPARISPAKDPQGSALPEPTEAGLEEVAAGGLAPGSPRELTSAGSSRDATHVVTLPAVAGEADPDVPDQTSIEELGSLIKPAAGTIAKNAPGTSPSGTEPEPEPVAAGGPTQKHG